MSAKKNLFATTRNVPLLIRNIVCEYKWWFLATFFLAVLFSMQINATRYALKLIVDSVASNNITTFSIVFYISISVLHVVRERASDYISLNLLPEIKSRVIQDAYQVILKKPYSFFQDRLSGTISGKIRAMGEGTCHIIQIITKFTNVCFTIIIGCILMYSISYKLCLVLVLWTLFIICVSILRTPNVSKLSHKFAHLFSNAVGHINDSISNIMVVKVFTAQKHEGVTSAKRLNEAKACERTMKWRILIIHAIESFSGTIMLSLCLYITVFEYQKTGNITPGDFAFVMALTHRISEAVWFMGEEITRFSEIYGSLSQGIEMANHGPEEDKGSAKIPNKPVIEFSNVDFSYVPSQPLFQNLNIKIPYGQKIGLVGISGAGKTSFVNLLLRFFSINSGEITLSGSSVYDFELNDLRASIALISQDTQLFNRTIEENILYGNRSKNTSDVIKCAKKAYAHDFISKLPNGYNSLIGERGIKLSGGQKQRLSIARTIMKDAQILIFDEPTSALDSQTEQHLGSAIEEASKDKTMIVIAHRFSTIKSMDRILVFDDGKIKQDGTHTDLIKNKKGVYYKLHKLQKFA